MKVIFVIVHQLHPIDIPTPFNRYKSQIIRICVCLFACFDNDFVCLHLNFIRNLSNELSYQKGYTTPTHACMPNKFRVPAVFATVFLGKILRQIIPDILKGYEYVK